MLLRWAVVFFVIAVVAAIFGFAGVATPGASDFARGLFFIFAAIFLIVLVAGLVEGRAPHARI
jgi:uncharacterized membrane protein YtjA (UPF0391 family)